MPLESFAHSLTILSDLLFYLTPMANSQSFSKSGNSRCVARFWLATTSGIVLSFNLLLAPAWAKDPFRTSNPKMIGDRVEAAFRAVFEKGHYADARKFLEAAEADEPLTHAMRGAMIYIDFQAAGNDATQKAAFLNDLNQSAEKVRETARQLSQKDPLRGNLYMAVGHFFRGGHAVLRDGTVKGTPQALSELQLAYRYLDEAEKIDRNDPELNLLKGYMDLLLAANLPFSSPDKAIERLEKYAGPKYLANRGLAMGYLALKQPEKALPPAKLALAEAKNNPELMYLNAQVFYALQNYKEATEWFNKALQMQAQLPPGMVRQITRERDRAQRKLASGV